VQALQHCCKLRMLQLDLLSAVPLAEPNKPVNRMRHSTWASITLPSITLKGYDTWFENQDQTRTCSLVLVSAGRHALLFALNTPPPRLTTTDFHSNLQNPPLYTPSTSNACRAPTLQSLQPHDQYIIDQRSQWLHPCAASILVCTPRGSQAQEPHNMQ
jgi:hypothetical protein